jgi:F-type H+-transporting ATPase subunit delta
MAGIVSRNYARALFELVGEEAKGAAQALDSVAADLALARDAIERDADFRVFLSSRIIAGKLKKEMIRSIFSDAIDARVLTLLFLIVDRGRTGLLTEIAAELQRLARHARGERDVTVWSAFPLGEEELARIKTALERRLGGHVILDLQSRPSLIGGVVAQCEGQEIEFSVEGRLKELAGRLTERSESR